MNFQIRFLLLGRSIVVGLSLFLALSSSTTTAQTCTDVFARGIANSQIAGDSNRDSVLRRRIHDRGQEFLRSEIAKRRGVKTIHVDVLAIGAGPFTAIFAANFSGKMLVVESTDRAGTFDRSRDSGFFANSEERPSQSGNPFPGSPVPVRALMTEANSVAASRSNGRYVRGSVLGDATLEALDFSQVPVLFGITAERGYNIDGHRYIVDLSDGTKIIAEKVIIGGQGEARLQLEPDPRIQQAIAQLYPQLKDETEGIARSDAMSERPRVVTADDVINESPSAPLHLSGNLVVTGSGHGALTAIIQLLKNRDIKRIEWVSQDGGDLAFADREIYHPVAKAILNGRVIAVQGRSIATTQSATTSKLSVYVFSKDKLERLDDVDRHIVAAGYNGTLKELFENFDLGNNSRPTIVNGDIAPLTGIRPLKNTPVAIALGNLHLLGPASVPVVERGVDLIPSELLQARIGTIIDLFGRQAAALGQKLSTTPKMWIEAEDRSFIAPKPRIRVASTLLPLTDRVAAEAEVRKTVGRLLKGKIVSGTEIGLTELIISVDTVIRNTEQQWKTRTNSLEDRDIIISNHIVIKRNGNIQSLKIVGLDKMIASEDFQRAVLALNSAGGAVRIEVPFVNGEPMLHSMVVLPQRQLFP